MTTGAANSGKKAKATEDDEEAKRLLAGLELKTIEDVPEDQRVPVIDDLMMKQIGLLDGLAKQTNNIQHALLRNKESFGAHLGETQKFLEQAESHYQEARNDLHLLHMRFYRNNICSPGVTKTAIEQIKKKSGEKNLSEAELQQELAKEKEVLMDQAINSTIAWGMSAIFENLDRLLKKTAVETLKDAYKDTVPNGPLYDLVRTGSPSGTHKFLDQLETQRKGTTNNLEKLSTRIASADSIEALDKFLAEYHAEVVAKSMEIKKNFTGTDDAFWDSYLKLELPKTEDSKR